MISLYVYLCKCFLILLQQSSTSPPGYLGVRLLGNGDATKRKKTGSGGQGECNGGADKKSMVEDELQAGHSKSPVSFLNDISVYIRLQAK